LLQILLAVDALDGHAGALELHHAPGARLDVRAVWLLRARAPEGRRVQKMTELTRRSFLSLLVATPALVKLPGVVLPPAPPAPPPPPIVPHKLDREELRRMLGRTLRERVEIAALPFGPDPSHGYTIPPGRIARFAARVILPYRPTRLIVASPGGELERLELLGVSAGGDPQIDPSLGAVPATLFDPKAYGAGAELVFASLAPGDEVVLCARNVGDSAAWFCPTFMGRTVRELSEVEAAADAARQAELARELDDELGDDFDDDDDDDEELDT
jgi:hypothetical protein